ncbi:hypothetical protein IscW_ISCW001658 [Ixodes scapularis]|uniref:Uncharacterized protein n=1 Tax=Ixodes scapularis TaxID=6945 RepID=B7P4Q9_IXOSC|nr:hypothetical protein IscW_ISCW001658 [Ixodes scapularis]|eukprot:XP_002406354.1 hypothetical protein IscW_ISCW001658 [Ixodes scapularis]
MAALQTGIQRKAFCSLSLFFIYIYGTVLQNKWVHSHTSTLKCLCTVFALHM